MPYSLQERADIIGGKKTPANYFKEVGISSSSLIKKLAFRPGMSVLVLNAPPGYLPSLTELPEGVRISKQPEGRYDFVQLFIQDSAQFKALSSAA